MPSHKPIAITLLLFLTISLAAEAQLLQLGPKKQKRQVCIFNCVKKRSLFKKRSALPSPQIATTATDDSNSINYKSGPLKTQRQRAPVQTLLEVDSEPINFPDEPPIVYPDSKRWERIAASRQKYKDMGLSGRKLNENERRIKEALDDDTEMEYDATELKEVVQDLKDKHGIEIVIDEGKLEDFTPITINLKGVSLRSALKLMLKEAEATYIIRDGVLLITTEEEASKELTTKVYPVENIIPIETPDFKGGFGGMGGLGESIEIKGLESTDDLEGMDGK